MWEKAQEMPEAATVLPIDKWTQHKFRAAMQKRFKTACSVPVTISRFRHCKSNPYGHPSNIYLWVIFMRTIFYVLRKAHMLCYLD